MSEPISLAARRWDASDGRPSSHSVREMLEAAIVRLDRGEIDVQHAILVYGTEAEGTGDDGYMQAGSFSPFAQIGLLHRGLELMKVGGDDA